MHRFLFVIDSKSIFSHIMCFWRIKYIHSRQLYGIVETVWLYEKSIFKQCLIKKYSLSDHVDRSFFCRDL